MKLEKIVQIIVPAVFAANTTYANEAIKATPTQIAETLQINDNANASQNNKEDWSHQKKLIESEHATVLIQPVEDKPGYCVVGLDGYPQKYDPPADARTLDGKLERSEWILNLSESNPKNKFYFPCDLKAETQKPTPTASIPIVSEPASKSVPETSKLPFLMFSPGISYMQIFGAENKTYDYSGILRGVSFSLTVQPSSTNWYWGGKFSVYGNTSSKSENVNVPATEGPLAGQLVMRGKKDYHLGNFGTGIGPILGYMIPFDKKSKFGLGLESEFGLMHNRVTHKFGESSAHYINGNILEGSTASNHSDNADNQFYGYLMPGLRIKLPFICGTISGGVRTADLNDFYSMLSAGVAYCPNKE